MEEVGIYIHFPFCKSRCDYCDFNTCASMESHIPAYCQNLHKEIKLISQHFKNDFHIRSIYLGGGTPSYLPPENIRQVIQTVLQNFMICPDVEISMEANPADIVPSKAVVWHTTGINRLSIGMQSAHDEELAMLGRRHRWLDVQQAVQIAKDAGFTNINLDVMFGLPGQSMQEWRSTVEKALSLAPTHLSLYALTVEEDTPLMHKLADGKLPQVDEDLAGDMYEWVMEYLSQHGFEQYEISNWAQQENDVDYRCQHNLLYWRNETYLGFGSAAHSHYGSNRWSNKTGILEYIKSVNDADDSGLFKLPFPWGDMYEELNLSEEMNDTAMMGLRLVKEGLRDDLFIQKFGCSLFEVYHDQIEELCAEELLAVDHNGEGSIYLTRRGCMVGNQVFMRFLSD